MFPRPYFQAVLIAVYTAAGAAHANPDLQATPTPATAVADEGVPDDGVTQEIAPKPAPPLVSTSVSAPRVDDAGGAGSAIYSPFVGVSEPPVGERNAAPPTPPTVAAGIALPLLAALAGVAAFVLLLRRKW